MSQDELCIENNSRSASVKEQQENQWVLFVKKHPVQYKIDID